MIYKNDYNNTPHYLLVSHSFVSQSNTIYRSNAEISLSFYFGIPKLEFRSVRIAALKECNSVTMALSAQRMRKFY
jgi:hypothetical protein